MSYRSVKKNSWKTGLGNVSLFFYNLKILGFVGSDTDLLGPFTLFEALFPFVPPLLCLPSLQ